jgi:hypothetical protein
MTTALETHCQEVQRRCKILSALAPQAWIATPAVEHQERKLLANLAAAAELGASEVFASPRKREDAFIYWAARRLSEPEADVMPALLEALGESGKAADGARDALDLLPPADDQAIAGAERWETVPIRLSFLGAAAHGDTSVSQALLNNALSQEPETQTAALAVAASDPQRAAATFGDWFAAGNTAVPATAKHTAAFAGLMRGDETAREALPRLFADAPDAQAQHQAARLMALAGGERYRADLLAYSESDPVRGTTLLGIHGHPANLEALVERLERPETAEAAAEAWWRITGLSLPRRPMMQALGEEQSETRGEVPDAEWADGWLQQQRQQLPEAEQLLFGRPVERGTLATACRSWAGTASADLLAQARLVIGPAPPLQPQQWIVQRLNRLDTAGLRKATTVAPEAATADPWEYGHYA